MGDGQVGLTKGSLELGEKPRQSVALRICMVVRALPVHRLGGLEYHARDLSVALARRGHSVDILTTKGGNAQSFPDDFNGLVRVHELSDSKGGDYSKRFYRVLEPELPQIIVDYRIDAVLVVDLAGLFITLKNFKVPVVPLIHGTLTSEVPLDWRYAGHLRWWEKLAAAWHHKHRLVLRPWFARMVSGAPMVIVDSEFSRRELLFEVGRSVPRLPWDVVELAQRIRVVPLAIDLERYMQSEGFHGESDEDTLRVCLLGRLQRQKGIEVAIRAAGILSRRGIKFRMDIGGTGDYLSDGASLIAELGIGDKVRLHGRIEPEDVGTFFCEHDVFIFPDLTQPAFGLVALEAMHYGLPVIAARVGAVPEVVNEECGWLYDAWDVEGLAMILAEVAASAELLNEKAAGAKNRALEFTVEKMAWGVERCLIESVNLTLGID